MSRVRASVVRVPTLCLLGWATATVECSDFADGNPKTLEWKDVESVMEGLRERRCD